jgi:hypothetical protein
MAWDGAISCPGANAYRHEHVMFAWKQRLEEAEEEKNIAERKSAAIVSEAHLVVAEKGFSYWLLADQRFEETASIVAQANYTAGRHVARGAVSSR